MPIEQWKFLHRKYILKKEDRRAAWMASLWGPRSARGGRCHMLIWFDLYFPRTWSAFLHQSFSLPPISIYVFQHSIIHVIRKKWPYTAHRAVVRSVSSYEWCMVLHGIALYCIVLHGIAWYCIVLHCIALYCMVLHAFAWYCMVLHGIALYCI